MNEWETCIDEWAERLRVSQKETADAQATIADLQEKIAVERANKESAVACVDRDVKKISALQQRVAQLEMDNRTYINERHENMKTIEALQANYDRVLGLVQEIVNAGVSMEDPRIAYKEVQIDREWFARAAASLPAQPARSHGKGK